MSSPFGAAYYERLQGELRGLFIEMEENFAPQECELLGTLIDANELGVALEMMIESIEASGAVIAPRSADGLNRAAAAMGLDARFQRPETTPAQPSPPNQDHPWP